MDFIRLSLGSEFIVAPNIKMSLTGETAKYQNERPRNLGYNAKLGTVLSERLFAKAGYSYRKEITSEVLHTIGGHLTYHSSFAELTYEPLYDLLVSASYQLTSEKQDEIAAGRITQLAFDQYGVAISYDWDEIKTTIKGSYLMPNQFANQVNMEGAVEWTF